MLVYDIYFFVFSDDISLEGLQEELEECKNVEVSGYNLTSYKF